MEFEKIERTYNRVSANIHNTQEENTNENNATVTFTQYIETVLKQFKINLNQNKNATFFYIGQIS